MEALDLTFINSLDRRGDLCVHVLNKDRKYVLTLYGHDANDMDKIRHTLVDCLAHAAVYEWIDKHGKEAGFGEVRGQRQSAPPDEPGADAA